MLTFGDREGSLELIGNRHTKHACGDLGGFASHTPTPCAGDDNMPSGKKDRFIRGGMITILHMKRLGKSPIRWKI